MKSILLRLLVPVAALTRRALLKPARLWHHACLRAGVERVGPATVVMGAVEVHGSGRVALGDDCLLYPGLYLETAAEGCIRIGDGCVFSRGVHVSSRSAVTFGTGCMIGEYSSIRDANHRYGAGDSIRDSGYNSAPVLLGDNVWVGRGAVILPGVSIGDNAVIAANSVVNRSVPANALAGGIPARVLRDLTEVARA